ncbi:SRPBCC family protein [Halobellus sp. Atlit-31R]|nr:SRPBCC family protein [Halobellus sp. Atlit-31R]
MTTERRVERTPDGRRLLVSRQIDAPPELVWDLFVDTRQWPRWGPSITAVECSERRIREGTTGRVRTVGGLRVSFVVTACEDCRWTWRVAGIPATGHRVETTEGGCRAVFEIPLLAAPYAAVCERALRSLDALAMERSRGD